MTVRDVPSGAGGLRPILIATGVAGVGGYAITAVVAGGLGQDYALFAVFWSALYLVIGTLSGVQQEFARGSDPVALDAIRSGARIPALSAAIAAFVAVFVAASSPFWSHLIFPPESASLVVPLVFGAASYVFVAATSGMLYGTRVWLPLSWLIVLDVVFRLVLVIGGLVAGIDVVGLAWLCVLPFPLVLGVAVAVRRRALWTARLDVPAGRAVANVSRTLAGAAATSVLVSGFPLLLRASSPRASDLLLSAVIFALVLTRAPLVVLTLAMQSYLVVYFRDSPRSRGRILAVILGAISVAGGVLALIAYAIGAEIIVLIAGEDFRLEPGFLALLMLSSIPTGWIAVTGALVLAGSGHTAYAAGWVVSATAAAVLLFVPGDLFVRSVVSLTCGPIAGLILHAIAASLRGRQRDQSRSSG